MQHGHIKHISHLSYIFVVRNIFKKNKMKNCKKKKKQSVSQFFDIPRKTFGAVQRKKK